MSETWSAPPNEPADGLDDLGFGLWDPSDPRFQTPQIFLQSDPLNSLEYSVNNNDNTHGSNIASYHNGYPGFSNYPPLECFQRLNLEPPLSGYTTPYNWSAANIPFPGDALYNRSLAPSPQAPRAIPASYQPDFKDYQSSYHGSSAPPTLARGAISASSHHPRTPQRPPTEQSHEDSRRYPCSECGKGFKQRKDLDRHRPKHDPKTPDGQKVKGRYLCRCGKGTHRKDNHKRHLTTCVPKKYEYDAFVCQCLFETSYKKEHEDHIGRCREGIKPVGRPSRSRATSTIASMED